MRIGVVSDTHGNSQCLRIAVEQMGKIDLLVHAGDNYKDAIAISRETGIKTVAVTGNCDWSPPDSEEAEFEIDNYKVLVTHGHLYDVKTDLRKLEEKQKQGNYDLVIYGHSHVPEITYMPGGILFNPGSTSRPRRGTTRSYGIVEISKNGIFPYIHNLNWQP